MLSYYYGNFDYWALNQKVTFDGTNKLIYIAPGVTTLDVKVDLYSDWKEWAALRDNAKFLPALSSIGGEPLPGNRFVGATFFLTNGWRIRTWEGHHTLSIVGNLFTTEGDSCFIPTLESWTITINAIQSTLVDGLTGLTAAQSIKLDSIPSYTLEADERSYLLSIPSSGAVLNISGMTQAEHDKLMSITSSTLESDERAKLLSLSNIDLVALVDAIWDKEIKTGVTAAEYIVNKLLTTNKFIGLK